MGYKQKDNSGVFSAHSDLDSRPGNLAGFCQQDEKPAPWADTKRLVAVSDRNGGFPRYHAAAANGGSVHGL